LERSGQRATTRGVSLKEDGTINLPLTFPGSGGLNLVPINFLVKAAIAIMDSGKTGIFHIVNQQTETIHQLHRISRNIMPFQVYLCLKTLCKMDLYKL